MQFIATFVMLLFLFQFSAPLVQTGIGHTPKECQKLYEKYEKKRDKATELNTKLKGLKEDQIYTIVKKTLLDATIGGIVTGGVSLVLLKEALKKVLTKLAPGGAVVVGVWAAINSYRSTQAEINKVEAKRDEINKESRKLWEDYLECINHTHASGSLSPYMNSPTNISSGQSHSAHLSATEPFQSVYWYVRAPGESGLGTHISTDTGDGAKTDSYFSYTPSTSGTYTITAYTYFTNTISEPSYDITVSSY